jgi:hypothetical protein
MEDIKNDFYVYMHIKEESDEIFYVGKGRKNRAFSKHGRNKHWNNIVQKYNYKVDILYEGLTNDEACIIEKDFIKKIGRKDLMLGTLVNMTDGGDGVVGNEPWNKGKKMDPSWNKGRIISEETKLKISESNKGRKQGPAWNKGLKHSDETIQKMKKRIPWNKGLKHSDESKIKMSNSRKKYLEELEEKNSNL